MRTKFLSVIISAVLAVGVAAPLNINGESQYKYREVDFHGLTVNDGEPIKGADISSVISLENSGVVFRNENGDPQDIFLTLKEAGINYIRVRVWNEPYDENGRTYGGGANDIETAVKIASRCEKYGLKLLVDFHYSDFWADPGEQQVPKAWKNYSVSQKADAIREFTRNSLEKIKATGVTIGMVQIGNETVSGLCGETKWDNISVLMKAGSETVRAFDKNILVALHFTNPDKAGNYKWLSDTLYKYGIDYDVFASSYYPFWHGSTENLTDQLSYVANTYGKYVMAAETSWVSSLEDYDQYPNTIRPDSSLGDGKKYGVGVQAQIDSVTDVFQAVADVGEKGIGVCYWEPAWIKVGDDYQENAALWDQFGSGACSTASGNFADWTGRPGGSAVDNQALFAQDGAPLESLYLFNHIHASSSENLIPDSGFESGKQGIWTVTNTTSGEYSKFELNSEMNRTGNYAYHWYSPDDFKESRLTSEITVDKSGDYTFSAYISGENSYYVTDVYVNNEWISKDTGEVSGYGTWNKANVSFRAEKGDKVKIEFIINGWSGSYGSVDDVSLYLAESAPESDRPSHEPVTEPEKKREKGDISFDEKINSADILLLKNYMLGISELSEEDTPYADMDDDGKISVADFVKIKSIILSVNIH